MASWPLQAQMQLSAQMGMYLQRPPQGACSSCTTLDTLSFIKRGTSAHLHQLQLQIRHIWPSWAPCVDGSTDVLPQITPSLH